MSDQEKGKEKIIEIPIEWEFNDDIESTYVNHLRITHAGPEFYVYFGELVFPGMLLEEGPPKKLTVRTKVRVVISPEQMGKFINALNENYENYLNKKKAKE